MTDVYDVVIVGGGPAGLSAAIVLGRCRRRVLLCDVGQPRNQASQAVHCLLGHEGMSPGDLLARGRLELEQYPRNRARGKFQRPFWLLWPMPPGLATRSCHPVCSVRLEAYRHHRDRGRACATDVPDRRRFSVSWGCSLTLQSARTSPPSHEPLSNYRA